MSRAWGIISGGALCCALVCAAATSASAQSFGGLVDKAESVDSVEALSALFWSQSANCSKVSGDLAKRQCVGISNARKQELAGSSFLVKAGAGSLTLGSYDAKKKKLSLAVRGCVACAAPLEVAGKRVFVVAGAASMAVKARQVGMSPLHTAHIPVASKKAAARFTDKVLPRLKTQLVVKVGSAKAWKSGASSGYRVELLGYRVYDPCDGKVYAAKPKSSSVAPDERYCSGEPVVEETVKESVSKPVKATPKLPRRLSPGQLRTGLESARKAAVACFDTYGVAGKARFRITISADGEVVGMREKGDFVGTPTSKCIRAAVKVATFPKTRKPRTTIDYPFILR